MHIWDIIGWELKQNRNTYSQTTHLFLGYKEKETEPRPSLCFPFPKDCLNYICSSLMIMSSVNQALGCYWMAFITLQFWRLEVGIEFLQAKMKVHQGWLPSRRSRGESMFLPFSVYRLPACILWLLDCFHFQNQQCAAEYVSCCIASASIFHL